MVGLVDAVVGCGPRSGYETRDGGQESVDSAQCGTRAARRKLKPRLNPKWWPPSYIRLRSNFSVSEHAVRPGCHILLQSCPSRNTVEQ